MFRKIIFLALTFTFLLTACLPVGQIEVDIETPTPGDQTPPSTDESIPTESTSPTETSSVVVTEEPSRGLTGTVTGRVCYPSEFLPAMNAYFRNANTGELTELAVPENQGGFSLELPAGLYEAFAYMQEGELGGSYSLAVLCGLTVECVDHSLVAFEVQAGQTTSNIDICDWYEPAAVPVNPRASLSTDPSLAGLIYQDLTSNSTWRVNTNGTTTPILAQYGEAISPDGTQAIFLKNDDLWLADLTTGTWRNLTNTPDRSESFAAWVPGTDLIATTSYNPAETTGLPTWRLTFVHSDGTGYEVIDPDLDPLWGEPAVSPTGEWVAYDVAGKARLYRVGSGSEDFDPAQYGLNGVEKISAPAFSPDGTKLAWWVGGPMGNENWQNALAVFDLSAGTYTLIHPYVPVSGEGFINPVWSPDGQWLAGHVIGDGSRSALWVFRADGSEEHQIGNGGQAVWSPQSNALLFLQWTDGPAQEGGLSKVIIGDWSVVPLNLQPGSFPLAWPIGQ